MKSMNLGSKKGVSAVVAVTEIPELDAILHFAKPSIPAAGLLLEKTRITLYSTLDSTPQGGYVDWSMFETPSEALFFLLNSYGIECGRADDGSGLQGKIVDLTEPSMATPIHDVYPHMTVKDNCVLFDFKDIIALAWKRYPDNVWQ